MPARNLTYHPAAQTTAATRPSLDGGWCVVFPPAVGTHNPRSRETTRVAPFAHLHSHPFGTHNPSDDDFYAAAILNNRFKCSSDPVTMPTYIYSHGKSRRYFNKALEPSEQEWKDLFQYINNYKPQGCY